MTKAADLASKLALISVEDWKATHNWMVYGLTGAGKTDLAASLPSNTFLAAEPGILAAVGASRRFGTHPKMIRVRTWEQVEEFVRQAEAGNFDTEWLTIDTLSTVQIMCFRWWTTKQNGLNPKWDEDIPDQGGHQKVQFLTRKLVSRLVDTDYNVLFTCHAQQTEDKDGSGLWLPAIEGQAKKGYLVANYCMGLMNAVGYMRAVTDPDKARTEHRRILWKLYHDPESDIIYTAKEQYGGALGRYTDDKSMPELLAMAERGMTGGKGKKEKEKAKA